VESHRQIEESAAAFLARRDGSDWSPADDDALRQWMDHAVAHRVAFLRLEAVWEQARRLKTLAAGLPAGLVPAAGEWQKSPFFAADVPESRDEATASVAIDAATTVRRRRGPQLRRFAAAAAIIVAVGTSIYLYRDRAEDQYVTPMGGLATVPLSDGSAVTLNTATKIRVEYTPEQRAVRLDRGEAFFVVAKDAGRPFVVRVANKRVIAVGTQFSVRRDGDDVRVEVTEGRVRVQSGPESLRLASNSGTDVLQPAKPPPGDGTGARGDHDFLLTPGVVAESSNDGLVLQERNVAEIEDDLTWRQGYLTFRNTLLSDVVAQFNRYNARKLRIDDAGTGAIRISGTFRTQNYDAFVRVMSDGFALKARQFGDATVLSK
jgi:transmembrane sensor